MKIQKPMLTIATGVLLAVFSGMALASPNPQKQSSPAAAKQALPKPDKSVTSVSQGTIMSISSDRLVLSHKKKDGKMEEMTFTLSPKTERQGDLISGAQVSVHYQTENSHLMATAIQAMPQKAATHTAEPVVKK